MISGMKFITDTTQIYYGFGVKHVIINGDKFVYFPYFNKLFQRQTLIAHEVICEFIFCYLTKREIMTALDDFSESSSVIDEILINTLTTHVWAKSSTAVLLKCFNFVSGELCPDIERINRYRMSFSRNETEALELRCKIFAQNYPDFDLFELHTPTEEEEEEFEEEEEEEFEEEEEYEEEESEEFDMVSNDYYEKYVNGYSHTRPSSSQFIKTQADNEDTKEFYGIELEFSGDEPTDDVNMFEILSDLLDEQGLMKTDSSIHGYQSFELVTMPLTANALRDDICHIEKIMKVIERNNFDTDESCGMHVHVNRKFFGASGSQNFKDLIECKILLCLARNEDVLKDIAQREHYEYCDFNLLQFLDDSAVSTALKIDKYKQDKSSERYQALNTTNYETLEFRFMSSTLNYETFIYRFNVIRAICVYVKYHTGEECYRATLDEILAYEREV